MQLIYKDNFDLFNAPKNVVLAHACNAKGVWGSGVAVQFKKYFPVEYELYYHYCNNVKKSVLGTSVLLNRVGCLITSLGYGDSVDPEDRIILNTKTSFTQLLDNTTSDIYIPKINSGLFKVPWEKTEEVILEVIKNRSSERNIYVCSL